MLLSTFLSSNGKILKGKTFLSFSGGGEAVASAVAQFIRTP